MINNIKKLVAIGTPLFNFYRHDDNTSGLDTASQITPERMRQHLEANAIRTKWLTENMPEIKDFVHYCEISFMISLWERIYLLDVRSCFEIAAEVKAYILRYIDFLLEHDFCSTHEKEVLSSIST